MMEKLRVQSSPNEAGGKSGQNVVCLGFSGMPGPEEQRHQGVCSPSSPSPFLQDQLLRFPRRPTPPPRGRSGESSPVLEPRDPSLANPHVLSTVHSDGAGMDT